MKFLPKAGDTLALDLDGDQALYRFMAHPDQRLKAAGVPHSMCGDKSTVWRMQDHAPGGEEFALKVMNRAYRDPNLPQISNYLRTLLELPGLECCDRFCITRTNCRSVASYSELEYATLMPWIRGTSWFDAHQNHESVRSLSEWQSLRLARALTKTLGALEDKQLAHCCLTPGNVLVGFVDGRARVELVGLEGLHGPHLPGENGMRTPPFGYSHRTVQSSGTASTSDRFAGGLLIVEMLTWYSTSVRTHLYSAECYFDPEEIQDPAAERYRTLLAATARQHRELGALFERLWTSKAEAQAPSFQDWLEVLNRVANSKICYSWLPDTDSVQADPPTRRWAVEQVSESGASA